MRILVPAVFVFALAVSAAAQVPSAVEAARANICQIILIESTGQRGYATGVLVAGTEPVVATAGHSFDEVRVSRILCVFSGKSYAGTLAAVSGHPGPDCALVKLGKWPDGLKGVPLQGIGSVPGEKVYAYGFGAPNEPGRWWYGNDLGNGDFGSLTLPGTPRQGDSGGPVFLCRSGIPTLAGIIWGYSQRGRTSATRVRHVKALFSGGRSDEKRSTVPRARAPQPVLVPRIDPHPC